MASILLVVRSTWLASRVLFCAAAKPATRRVNSSEMANMVPGGSYNCSMWDREKLHVENLA